MDYDSVFWSFYRRLTVFEQEYIKNGGLSSDCSYMDMVCMDIIMFNDDCTPSLISERLGVAKSAVTVRLKRLEEEGYLVRKVSEKDRRSYVLALTEKALGAYAPLNDLFKEFEKNLKFEFSPEELELGRRMLLCAIKQ